MAMSDWSERTRLLITIGVAVVINAGVWGLVYKAHGDWTKKENERKNLVKEVDGLKVEANKKTDLVTELKRLSTQKEELENRLPKTHERDRFFTDLVQLAEQKGIRYLGYVPRYDVPVSVPGLNPQNFKKDVYSTNYEADFKSICEFINYFEEFYPRFIQIENLSINANAGGMNITGAKHNVSFDVVTYYYIPTPGQ